MATTVIDSLIVLLGIDTKDLDNKQGGAVKKFTELEKAADKTEKTTAKISKTSKETARSVEGLSHSVAGFLAIIGGTVAIKSFVQDFIDTNAQLERLSKNLGLSVPTISAWSNATEKFGGSAQALQGTLDMLSKSQTQLMLTGESSLLPYMSALGVSLADVGGKARPVTDILLDLSDRFSHMDRTTANNLGRMMGLDQGTLNILLQGRKELELEIKRQKEQTAVTAAQAAQAQKFQTQIVGLKQRFEALGRSLLEKAAPYLEKFLDLLERFGTWAQEHQQFIEDFLKVMAVGLGAIALATLPINLTVLAILALGAAIALLWDDYQTWKKGGDSFIDWGKWEPGINAAINGLQRLSDAMFFVVKGAKIIGDIQAFDFIGAKRDALENPPDITQSPLAKKARGLFQREGSKSGSESGSVSDMLEYFQKQGWTREQAAGIVANIIGESSGNPGLTGDNGSAYGLAQWHPDRQADFANFTGHDIRQSKDPMTEQLAFIQYELTRGKYKGIGRQLALQGNTADATSVVTRGYEIPADPDLRTSQRSSYAAALVGIPGAASIVQNAPGASTGTTVVDRGIKTDIGTVIVHTQATDAAGMVSDMDRAMDYLFASQANYGLTP